MILKIIGIIGLVVFYFFSLSVVYINGLMRGLKIMSNKDIKTTKFEKNLINKVFEKSLNGKPFFENMFVKNQMRDMVQEIKEKQKKESKVKKVKSKKNVKKTKK